jgi:hypothetical protein
LPPASRQTVLALQRQVGNEAATAAVRHADPARRDAERHPGPTVQRITPEDAGSELVGRSFALAEAFTTTGGVTIAKGSTVTVHAWDNGAAEVSVRAAGIAAPLRVPKRLLRPVAPAGTLAPYSAGVAGQADAVKKAEAQFAAWTAKMPTYIHPKSTPKQYAIFFGEQARLAALLAKRNEVLNRKLIQETMFNRFDPIIEVEVAAANKAHGLSGAKALDPNLVKAMIFQESQMGTSGVHLEVPPSHPVKTRFNLAQVVDSSALALLTLMEKEHPAIVGKFKLGSLRTDLAAAQRERETLKTKTTRTAAESARLAGLEAQLKQSGEPFIWGYVAAGETEGFLAAVMELFAGTTPPRNEDYTFWIHIAVMWLFAKRRAGMTWPDAIRAYNGSGPRAERYRDEVVGRADAAKTAAAAKKPFVPGKI